MTPKKIEQPKSEFEIKYPQFAAWKSQLEAEREQVVAATKELRAERDTLADQIRPIEDRIRMLNMQIRAIEQPRLAEIDNQLGGIAKAAGGRSMQQAAE